MDHPQQQQSICIFNTDANIMLYDYRCIFHSYRASALVETISLAVASPPADDDNYDDDAAHS